MNDLVIRQLNRTEEISYNLLLLADETIEAIKRHAIAYKTTLNIYANK